MTAPEPPAFRLAPGTEPTPQHVHAAPWPPPCQHVIHPAEAERAARGEVVATFCAACFDPVILNAPETQQPPT